MADDKGHPDRFIIEVGNLGLSHEQTKSLMNDIVKSALSRIKDIGIRADAFEQWVSFEKWQSFGQAGG